MNMIAPKRTNRHTMSFMYEHDYDGNGLVYWLATQGNRVNRYENPMVNKLINVTSSGLILDNNSSPAHAVVGDQAVRCLTKPHRNAWFVIDFQSYAIQPTHYTLRHYSSCHTEALRNWRLEGSCNGTEWYTIREHKNDKALKSKGQFATWLLSCRYYFSKFRIFQFDKNSNKHYYLALSGFEIYGRVIRQNPFYTWDSFPRNKSRHLQVNKCFNTCRNVNSNDYWQTVKATQPLILTQQSPIQEFTVLIENSTKTTNSWKFMVGIAPAEFQCRGSSRQWLGSQASWGYIGGTGGKLNNNKGKSLEYGDKFGQQGDAITCIVDGSKRSIEFLLNGESQEIAFTNLSDPYKNAYHPAASLTATASRVRLMERVSPNSPFQILKEAQMQQFNYNNNNTNNIQQINRQFGGMSVSINPNDMAQNNSLNGNTNTNRNANTSAQSPSNISFKQLHLEKNKDKNKEDKQGNSTNDSITVEMKQDNQNENESESDGLSYRHMPLDMLQAKARGVPYGWDPILKSANLFILSDGITVTNKGSNDKWEGIISRAEFSTGKHSFEVEIVCAMNTTNTWKFVIGVVPSNFDPTETCWIGSQKSWGYIGGTGGKCHQVGKSVAYGKRYGNNDVIRCEIDYNKRTIEFFKNDKSQGVAFKNLQGAVKPGVSFTGKGNRLRIRSVQ